MRDGRLAMVARRVLYCAVLNLGCLGDVHVPGWCHHVVVVRNAMRREQAGIVVVDSTLGCIIFIAGCGYLTYVL